jgi:hypothetical protein
MSKGTKKFVEKKDKKTEDQLMIQSVMNSSYSLFIPYWNAEFIGVTHPLTKNTHRFSTNSAKLVEFLNELSDLGLGSKIEKDFIDLFKYDQKWIAIWNNVKAQMNTEV